MGKKRGRRTSDVMETFRKDAARKWTFMLLGLLLLFVLVLFALSMGSSNMSIEEALLGLLGRGNERYEVIIWRIRMPRVVTAILAGLALASAGATIQTVLRNPIGSPITLGISQAAAFGAAFAVVVLGAGSIRSGTIDAVIGDNIYMISACAFLSSLISTAVIIMLARFRRASPESMILAGVAMGSLATAGTTAIEYFADDVQLSSIIFWTFGDLGRTGWDEVALLCIVTLPALVFFILSGWKFNAMDTGEDAAKSLGVNVERLRVLGLGVSSLLSAVVISMVGIIGFVGLVVPHIVRKVIGGDQRFLIPASGIAGAVLLLAADTVARTVIAPVVLPVGIITSFLGAPLFLYLVIRGKEHW